MLRRLFFLLLTLILSVGFASAQLATITRETVNNVQATQFMGAGKPIAGKFSPDGKLLGLVGSFGVQLYELSAPDIPDTLGGEQFLGTSLSFSPDNRYLAITAIYSVWLFDLESGEPPLVVYPTDTLGVITAVAVHPDSAQLAVGSASENGRIVILDAATLTTRFTSDAFTNSVSVLAYSDDGGILAAGSNDGSVALFDGNTHELQLKITGHTAKVTGLIFAPGTLYTTGLDGMVNAYSLPDGTFINTVYTTPNAIETATLAPSGELYISETVINPDTSLPVSSLVTALDTASGSAAEFLTTAHRLPITAVDLSPDGSRLLSVSGDFANLLEVQSKSGFGFPFMDSIYALSLTNDGSGIALGGTSDLGSLYGVGGSLFTNIQTDESPIRTLAYDNSGGALVAGTDASHVYIFGGDGQRIALIDTPAPLTAAAFNPDNTLIAMGFKDGTLRLYNTADLTVQTEMTLHADAITSLDFNTDGTRILTGSLDTTALVWEVPSLTVLNIVTTITPVTSVEFNADATQALIGGYLGAANVWDIATATELFSLSDHYGNLTSAHFSPDGTLILTTCDDGSERLYDATTGEQLNVFYNHNAAVYNGAWLPDGAGFVTVGGDGYGILYEVIP